MAFTPQQMQALALILKMEPSQRDQLLSLSEATTPSPRHSVSGSSVDASSVDEAVAGSPALSASSDERQRHHEKDNITKLASYIAKNYLKSKEVWRFLYARQKYMDNDNLQSLLTKIKPVLNKKRQLLLQKQLDENRPAFFRMLKRRVSSAKDYRIVALKAGRNWQPGALCNTIDLTNEDSEGSESETDAKAERTNTQVKSEDEDDKSEVDDDKSPEVEDGKSPEVEDGKSDVEHKTPKVVRRQLAKDFAERMSVRRRKKQVARKAQGLPVNARIKSNIGKRKASHATKKNKKRSKTQPNKQNEDPEEEPEVMVPFKVGDRVSAKWTGKHQHGKWFPGSICSIDVKAKTMHVEFEDGDYDRKVKWSNIIITWWVTYVGIW